MRHLYSLNEFTRKDIDHFLERALYHKQKPYAETLKNRQFALLFLNPSLRTRCSFEVAIRQLAGGVTTLEGQMLWKLETEMGKKMDEDKSEHVIEAMGVLSRYFDGLGLRSFARGLNREEDLLDQTFVSFMENAKIPVFNMESAVYHPCQAMADLLTIRELLGGFKDRKISIMWASHPLALPMAVPNSILIASTMAGMDVTLAHPKGFELQEGIIGMAKDFAAREGGSLRIVNDRAEGAKGAEVVYAKAWGGLSRYDDPEGELALRKKHPEWIVDTPLMELTHRAYFMHCLPVRRNVVVTDEVIDSKQSVVFRQSENRLHAQKAILEWMFFVSAQRPTDLAARASRGCLPILVILLLAGPLPARPGGDAPEAPASLGLAIPSDAVFYMHWKLDETAGLARQLSAVWSALGSSGFLEEARARWVEAVEEKSPRGGEKKKRWFEAETGRWREALESVPWARLAAREGSIALRMEGPLPQAIAFLRVDPKDRESIVGALRKLLHAFSSSSTRFELQQSVQDGQSIEVLYERPGGAGEESEAQGDTRLAGLVEELLGGGARQLCLAAEGNIIGLATSANLMSRSLQLLDGRGRDVGFQLSAHRLEAIELLKAPSPGKALGFEIHARPAELFEGVAGLGAYETFVLAGGSDGTSLAFDYRAELSSGDRGPVGAARRALEKAGIGEMLRILPKNAGSFRVGSGILLEAWADLARKVSENLAPDEAPGETSSLIREAASHLTGRHALSFGLAGPFAAIELDEDGSRLLAERFRAAKSRGEDIVEEEGAILFRPRPDAKSLLALSGNMLLGGAAGAIKSSIAARSGKEPSLADDQPRLEALGALSRDLLALGDFDLRPVIAGAGAGALLGPSLARLLPEGEENALPRAFIAALPKLGPAAGSLSFLGKLASQARRDGPSAVRGEVRVTIAAADTAGESGKD